MDYVREREGGRHNICIYFYMENRKIILNLKDKKIIFFDGDGTIWYPRSTKRTQKPHWIYIDTATKDNYLDHLTLTPKARKTLLALKRIKITLVLISTNPSSAKKADLVLRDKLEHFKLDKVFDSYCSSPEYQEGKGEMILKILKDKKIPKSKALMVGDSYYYDYLSAKIVGVDALLIENSYARRPKNGKAPKNLIREIHELSEMLAD